MRVLAIETSGRVGSAALLEADESLSVFRAERRLPATERTVRTLLPEVRDMLRIAGWRAAELDLVCVATGPGSFTGLRIGVVTAKTLAYATGAKLVGVHTLAALAEGVVAAGENTASAPLWSILDAQRQELFVARFEPGQWTAAPAAPETTIMGVDAWLPRLRAGDAVSGPPLSKLRERLPAGVVVASEAHWEPQAASVGKLGVQMAIAGRTVDPLALVPRYFRQSAAEEKAESQVREQRA